MCIGEGGSDLLKNNTVERFVGDKIILVAGGAGFIGSHLCSRLVKEGHRVLCVDNLSTGNMNNISHLMSDDKFSFINHDVIYPMTVSNVAMIFNFACPASPVQYQKNPIHTYKTSIIGSMNLLEMARENGARILLASTSEVYGDPQVAVQNELYWGNVNPYGIRSCYDEGKRGAETLFHDYNNMYGVDTRIIRIFNTYGPNMSIWDGRVVSNFIVQALKGEPLTIHGNGTQTRSFQYVDDLIEAIMRVMQDGVQHGPINIGNPDEIEINTLASMVLEKTGSSSTVVCTPLPQDDPYRRRPDISLANKILDGWQPKVSIHEGLVRTIDYFRGVICK